VAAWPRGPGPAEGEESAWPLEQLMVKRKWPLRPPKNAGQKTDPSHGPKTQGRRRLTALGTLVSQPGAGGRTPQLQGAAMSRQGPPLLQEDEDDQDEDDDRIDDCLLLPRMGIAMSRKRPSLPQEDDGRNSDKDGQDGRNGQIEKIHKLHSCLL